MLKLRGLKFRYDKKPILRGVSLRVDSGEFIGILGQNGSGKSTLLKVIYGLHDLESGTIKLNDRKVLGPAYNHVPGDKEMQLVTQDSEVHPYMTVIENIESYFKLRTKNKLFYNKLLNLKSPADCYLCMVVRATLSSSSSTFLFPVLGMNEWSGVCLYQKH